MASSATAWKTKVERYMVYKAVVLKELLEWSEAQEGDYIDNNVIVKACAAKLSEEQATAREFPNLGSPHRVRKGHRGSYVPPSRLDERP